MPILPLRRRRARDRDPLSEPSAARTYWRIASAPSERLDVAGVGRSRWLVELARQRGGEAPLPLFAAADRAEESFSAEDVEQDVSLRPLTDGREVIEDYRSLQLSLRAHPLTFVCGELARRGVKRCAELTSIRDGRHVEVANIILVCQKPGSAKGVLFITIEDKSGISYGILWPDRFEAQRRNRPL
ncbi:hypothetical protein NS277_04285 [Novosphingobium barchaimii]|nr:hypothetical protein NS277_04285 [Novosphingobium barchaimii]